MRTFIGIPNQEIKFVPAVGKEHITSVTFDGNGELTTGHPLIIEKFFHVYDSYPGPSKLSESKPPANTHSCKKCSFIAENKSALMQHYKTAHPKDK